jgi:hypothetical protein
MSIILLKKEVGAQSRQSARLSPQSSELAPPPSHSETSVAPSFGSSWGEDNSDEGTDALVL